TPVLSVPQQDDNVVVNLANGDLDNELQEIATLERNNQFVVTPGNSSKLRLAISASTGSLRGSFIHPVTGRNTTHRGVVFQKQNLAQGYFLGTGESGFVSVVPIDEPAQLATPAVDASDPSPTGTPAE
ncbi:MAG: hypothetical protein ABIV39_09230, partial [Verrucomicrobiota bacterium]